MGRIYSGYDPFEYIYGYASYLVVLILIIERRIVGSQDVEV